MDVYLTTLGCRLNEAELETWSRAFRGAGHRVVARPERAQVLVLNSCAVTAEAARKSRQQVGRMHRANPSAHLVVTGCYAELEPERVAALAGVDLVVGNHDKDDLVARVSELNVAAMPAMATEPDGSHVYRSSRTRAFVKVQDGCRNRCTFCIVTVARGEERSKSIAALVDEINQLHADGYQEAVLTGVHLGGYGRDLGTDLRALVEAVLAGTSIPRIRLSSLEPWDLPRDFFSLWSDRRLMPHLHLPLQSGADTVLRRMARRGGGKAFRDLVRRARSRVPGINITTDIIAGFPGETAAEWRQTLALVEELGFGDLHVFPFSPRAGTRAAGLPGQLPAALVQERCRELLALGERLRQARLQARTGQTAAVLFEGAAAGKALRGYTPDYLRVVLDGTDDRGLSGSIRPVRLEAVADGQLRGRLVAG
jgi:threonylcarbamoyladenosine tRNA methylthiotransferase MtaB